MARNEFETEVGHLLTKYFPVVHRIPDAAFNREMGRQVSKKPFDYFGSTWFGTLVAAEVKRVKVNRFSFSDLKDHQRDALKDVRDAIGQAILFVNFRVKSPGFRCGRAFWIPFQVFMEIEALCFDLGRKSMTPDHIPDFCELDRVKGGWVIRETSMPSLLLARSTERCGFQSPRGVESD